VERAKAWIYKYDQNWFYICNQWPDLVILFFKWITYFGGAGLTISVQLLLHIAGPAFLKPAVLAASLALSISHLIAIFMKRFFRRIRPYLALPDAKVYGYLFKDHSFPSGHSTAIFSVAVPYCMSIPELAPLLLPFAALVAFSRVVLGVHYPSDIAAGAILGSLTALFFSYFI
jgi:undecaprenyl-diphosphatase